MLAGFEPVYYIKFRVMGNKEQLTGLVIVRKQKEKMIVGASI